MFKFFKTQNVSFNKANEERVVNLKCEFCGFEMNEGDVFCGKCGKKYENDLCDFTKHKYIWMGQLLGVLLEQNQYKYTIDLGKENIGLTYEMLRVWAQIIAPKDIAVKVKSTSIFGGVENKHRKNIKDASVTIYVNATCLFGGVDIK